MSDAPAPPPPSDPGAAPPPRAEDIVPEALAGYPVTLSIDRQDSYSRWLPFVKWLLAIPHYIVLIFLAIGAAVAVLISFFAVLITGRYPRGLFDFVVGVHRWALRVTGYVYLLTDSYPPFSLGDDPAYPVRYDIAYPEEGVNRWRPLIHWLLVIPYLFVATLLAYLAEILVFFAFFVILFTKQFPEGMFRIVLIALRWSARGNAYGAWMVTKYPPFAWG
jgi:Domain of unknown function (DUF4389)